MMTGKMLRKKSLTICLNVLYAKDEKTYSAYDSKHISKFEKQISLLMIPNRKGLYYFAGKKPSALLRKIISKVMGIVIA